MGLMTLAEGIDIKDKGACRICGIVFTRKHRVIPVWIVVGTTSHPKTGRKTLVLQARTDMPAPQNEYAHRDCNDVKHDNIARIESIERVTDMDLNMPNIEPRGDDAHCIECKTVFKRGDRITMVYTVQGVGKDPETGATAAKVTGMYEPMHVRCKDPKLEFGKPGDLLVL